MKRQQWGRPLGCFRYSRRSVNELALIYISSLSLPSQARDPDSGNFGVVRYRLTDTNAGVVTLDEETGALRLNQSYQDLGMRVSAIFTAQAYDNLAMEPSTTSTNVAIRVCWTVCLCVCLPACLRASLSVSLSVCLSV